MSKQRHQSETMRYALEHIRANGGTINRYPGGRWSTQGAMIRPIFNTTTIEALVTRAELQYTEWKNGLHRRFPIKAVIPETTHKDCCCFQCCLNASADSNPDCACDDIPVYHQQTCSVCPKAAFCDVNQQPETYQHEDGCGCDTCQGYTPPKPKPKGKKADPPSMREKFPLLSRLADQGDPHAQWLLDFSDGPMFPQGHTGDDAREELLP